MKRSFYFSCHYRQDKDIDVSLAIDCVCTGRKELNQEPNKYKSRKKYAKGELIVIWKDNRAEVFVIAVFGIFAADVCEKK